MSLKNITGKNYEESVVLSPKPVIINLYADWCKPCDLVENTLAEVNGDYSEYVEIVKMDLQQQPELTEMFEVETLPLVVMMTGGVVCKKIYGIPSKEEIIEQMELDTIKDFRDRGITYHPKRNYVPNYIRNEY